MTIKERSIDLSNLPRKSNGKINWGASVGCEVPFIYDGINGSITILNYLYPKITILYNDKRYIIPCSSIIHCRLRNIVLSSEFKYDIGLHIKL